jgi:hypothetical protein
MKFFATSLLALLPLVAAAPAANPEPAEGKEKRACALPSTYRWTDYGGPLAQPANGWVSSSSGSHPIKAHH